MNYRKLGNTGLCVSEIGFGAWGIGGDAYGKTDDILSLRTIKAAVDQGITFFDTSSFYGKGHSELLLGKGLKGVRDQVVIATKGGMISEGERNFSVEFLQKSLEESLGRLQTDYVDLYQLHSPSLRDIEVQSDLFDFLQKLLSRGLARAVGVSVANPGDAITFIQKFQVQTLQVNFNLLDQRVRGLDLLTLAREAQVGLIGRTPLCFGYLTGKYNPESVLKSNDHRNNWSLKQRKVWASGISKFRLPKSTLSKIQYALNFCLSFPEISTIIPGFLEPEHVFENVAAANMDRFSIDELGQLYRIYQSNQFYVS